MADLINEHRGRASTDADAGAPTLVAPGGFAAEADVVVVGSGAAGLFAATVLREAGLSALVLEAGERLGGSSAMSGGMVWLPDFRADGDLRVPDSREAAELYLGQLLNGHDAEDRIQAFLDTVPDVLDVLTSSTPVRMQRALDFPDYRNEPGCRTGRSWDQEPFPLSRLGGVDGVGGLVLAVENPPLTQRENRGLMGKQEKLRELVRSRREAGEVTSGVALVAALLRAALDHGAQLWTSARVVGSEPSGEGFSVTVESGERFFARRAVVWASGGYESDETIAHERLGVTPVPLGATTNRGDALAVLDALGADVNTAGDAWWMPVYAGDGRRPLTRDNARFGTRLLSLPGSILVDGSGRRFTNETLNYYDQGPVIRRRVREPEATVWAVFDDAFAARYPLPGFDRERAAWSADDIGQLAALVELPVDALIDTVQSFTQTAASGRDPDFARGESAHDRAIGDQQAAHPNLAPIVTAPFYALPVGLGTIGSNSGVATSTEAQVTDAAGDAVPGHYAIGNVAGSYLGPCYPGAGGTLGPNLVAAYRAARHIATS